MDASHLSSAIPPRHPRTNTTSHTAKDASQLPAPTAISPPESSHIKPLRASYLPQSQSDTPGSGTAALNQGAMDQWLQQNATTFPPAGFRSQLQPKVKLPLRSQAGDASSCINVRSPQCVHRTTNTCASIFRNVPCCILPAGIVCSLNLWEYMYVPMLNSAVLVLRKKNWTPETVQQQGVTLCRKSLRRYSRQLHKVMLLLLCVILIRMQ